MTGYTVHTGSSVQFSDGWDRVFAGKPQAGSKPKKKTTKKKAKPAKKSTTAKKRSTGKK